MLAAGTMLGPYRILAPLGAGGMGEVYRALDTRLAREVALKVIAGELSLDADRVRRFEQEARAAGALSHPNICTIHGVGTHDGVPFVVMELLEGESLRARLARGPIPVRKSLEFATQVARGLAAAHAKGIVHRDLKPENLFLTRDGRAVILDFGLAKLTRPVGVPVSRLQTVTAKAVDSGAILGTVGYMSPEQVRGDAVDHRADVFALGVVIQEMITGRNVFTGPSLVEVLNAILHHDPAPLAIPGGVAPAGLETLVRRCLEKEPGERVQDMRDLAFDLDTLARAESGSGRHLPPGVDARRPQGAVRALPITAAALLVGLAGLYAGANLNRPSRADSADYRQVTFQRGTITTARFSGDGKSVIYSAAWEGRPVELFEARPGVTTPRPLGLPPAHLLSVSKRGALLILMDPAGRISYLGQTLVGTLAEVPESGGEPRELLKGVQSADWAPDGATVALSTFETGGAKLQMPPGHSLYSSRGAIRLLRVSPRGDRLAFIECLNLPNLRGSVMIVDTSGRVLASTREWRGVSGLAWSADGREVWYCAAQDEEFVTNVRTLSPGGRERVVCRMPSGLALFDVAKDGPVLLSRFWRRQSIRGRDRLSVPERDLAWLDGSSAMEISPDGQTLVFAETHSAGGRYYSACLRGMDGSNPTRLGEGFAQSLSPNASGVLAIDLRSPNRLFVLPTGVGPVDSLPRAGMERFRGARWLPDGKRVVFFGNPAGEAARTYVQAVSAATARALTPAGIAALAPSGDGRFVAGRAGDQLTLYPVDQGVPRIVATLEPGEQVVRWAANGKNIFVATIGTEIRVSNINIANGLRSPHATFALADPAGVGMGSVVLSPDGAGYAFTYLRYLDELYWVTGLR